MLLFKYKIYRVAHKKVMIAIVVVMMMMMKQKKRERKGKKGKKKMTFLSYDERHTRGGGGKDLQNRPTERSNSSKGINNDARLGMKAESSELLLIGDTREWKEKQRRKEECSNSVSRLDCTANCTIC